MKIIINENKEIDKRTKSEKKAGYKESNQQYTTSVQGQIL